MEVQLGNKPVPYGTMTGHEKVEAELGMYCAMTVPGRRTESAVHIPVQLLPDRRHAVQKEEGCIGQIPDYRTCLPGICIFYKNQTVPGITINVPVVFMARYVMVLRGATSLLGALEGVDPENRDFFGP